MFTDIHNCCMLLGTADDILILCHKSPDGDTIGAAYGLYHALTQLGRRAAVRCSDPLPEKFAYIHGGIEMPEFEPQLIILPVRVCWARRWNSMRTGWISALTTM